MTFPREVVIDPSGRARCVPARELAALVDEPLAVRRTEEGWETHAHAAAWTFTTEHGAQLDLVDDSTGQARRVWSGGSHGPTRVFIDGSIVEVFTSTGSTTLRAYPAGGELWRVRSAGPLDAATLRAT